MAKCHCCVFLVWFFSHKLPISSLCNQDEKKTDKGAIIQWHVTNKNMRGVKIYFLQRLHTILVCFTMLHNLSYETNRNCMQPKLNLHLWILVACFTTMMQAMQCALIGCTGSYTMMTTLNLPPLNNSRAIVAFSVNHSTGPPSDLFLRGRVW